MSARAPRSLRTLLLVVLPSLLLAAAPLAALEAADGRVRLTLNESIGRFTIACQNSASGGAFVPLLAAQDPRTTVLSIVAGNKIYRMGESSEFSQKAERVPGGARFVWRSSFMQVTETFTFVPALDSDVSTGVRIDVSMKNLSEQEISAGARFLFDTYLGELGPVPFRTTAFPKITRERTLTPADKSPWWVSPLAGDPGEFGLQVMTDGVGITTPDRVVFANWKRLSDTSWDYQTSAARDFSLLPYSMNDSAVAQYYTPRRIPRSGEATITLVLGLYSKAGYSANAVVPVTAPVATTDFTANVQQSLSQGQNAANAGQAARADLSSVNAILNEINAKIASPGSLSDDELSLIQSALKDLDNRAGRYAPTPSGK